MLASYASKEKAGLVKGTEIEQVEIEKYSMPPGSWYVQYAEMQWNGCRALWYHKYVIWKVFDLMDVEAFAYGDWLRQNERRMSGGLHLNSETGAPTQQGGQQVVILGD